MINIGKSINVMLLISRIIPIDAEKIFYKIQYTSMIKALKKLGREETYLNIIQAICRKTNSQHHIKWGKKLKLFPLNSST
jgi:hypothetical protein